MCCLSIFEECMICFDYRINFSYCPYDSQHRWCVVCDKKMDKCPLCRKSFEKILFFGPSMHYSFNNLFFPTIINRPLL